MAADTSPAAGTSAATTLAVTTLADANRLADALADGPDAQLAARLCDLLLTGQPDLASAVFSRALESRQAYDNASLIPFHVALRALSLFAEDPAREDALRLARQILDRPPAPRLIAIGGVSGAGKSTLARALAVRLAPPPGGVWLRTDGIRKRLFGLPPEVRLGEDGYRPAVSRAVYRRLVRTTRTLLKQGLVVITEATFVRRASRNAMQRLAETAGVPFHGLWLDAPVEVMMARADRRAQAVETPDASDATAAIVALQAEDVRGRILWQRLDASGTPEEVLERALAALAGPPPA